MSIDTLTAQEERIAALETEVAGLRQKVSNVVQRLGLPDATEIDADRLAEIQRMTERLFPSPVTTVTDADPSFPDEKFVVLEVAATGTDDELVALQREWQRQVLQIAPDDPTRFRLSLSPS